MISVTDGFLLMLAGLYFLDTEGILPLFLGAAVLHEAGHFLALRVSGGHFRRLTLTAFGGRMDCSLPESIGGQIATFIAGPAVNLLLWAALFRTEWHLFAGANLLLGAFNLLPIRPLDGGEILECVCQGHGVRLRRGIGLMGAATVAFLGLFVWTEGGGLSLFLIGLFLTFLAGRSCAKMPCLL